MQTLYMMVGLPGSGKSYHAEEALINDGNTEIVSSDEIRKELFGDENDQTHNNEVFNEVHNRIKKLFAAGKNVVYDATNLSRKRRGAFLNTIPKEIRKVAVVMCTELDVCLKQNAQRERKVPEEVIMRMLKHMTVPTTEEGFGCVHYTRHSYNKNKALDYFLKTVGMNQDNPNHTLTLSEHMEKAYQRVVELTMYMDLNDTDRKILNMATLYHDIGKPICKTYETFSGKIDDHAHCYNHAEVGAYLYLCGELSNPYLGNMFAATDEEAISVATLIQNHMRFFDENFKLDEFEKYHGKRFRVLLELLHQADIEAH